MTKSSRPDGNQTVPPAKPLTRGWDGWDTWDAKSDINLQPLNPPQTVIEQESKAMTTPLPKAKLAYSVIEVADQLGVGRTMVYDLIRVGMLPSIKIGERRLVARTDLEAFVEALREGRAA